MGISSHAEGEQTYTEGYASHAEGVVTSASGDYSHAEGEGTLAKGYASHAEGGFTFAGGDYSHAAGIYTSASADFQSVIGMANKPSPNQGAFIIGNGTSAGARSNLLYASGSNVQITGSLYVSRSDNDQLSAIFATRGSKTNPAYTFIGDEDTGMFNLTTNTVALTGGGNIRLQISDSELRLNPGTTAAQTNILMANDDTIPLVSLTPRASVSVGSASYATVAQSVLGTITSASYANLYLTYGDILYPFVLEENDKIVAQIESPSGSALVYTVASSSIAGGTGNVYIYIKEDIDGYFGNLCDKFYRILFLKRIQDETSIILDFPKPAGKTSYGFTIPQNINPAVLDNIDQITKNVNQQLIDVGIGVTT
jgi:hypothetical protein